MAGKPSKPKDLDKLKEIKLLMTVDMNAAYQKLQEMFGKDGLGKMLDETRLEMKTDLFIDQFHNFRKAREILGGLIVNNYVDEFTLEWDKNRYDKTEVRALLYHLKQKNFLIERTYKQLSIIAKMVFNVEVADTSIRQGKNADPGIIETLGI